MADLAQLELALRNADAAGDVEAAKMLAQAIVKARQQPEPTAADRVGAFARDLLAGGVRGAGSIGATLLTPVDAAARALGIQNDFIGRTDRREAMDAGLRNLGADTDSLTFKAGKLGAEIAGTAGAGGVLAKGAGVVLPRLGVAKPAVDATVKALDTAGFSTGLKPATAVGAVGNQALRAGAGAAAGGAGVALINPEDAAEGAAVGAVLPGAISAAGKAGRAIGDVLKSDKGAKELAIALGAKSPEEVAAIVERLRAGTDRILVPGSSPTVAQVLNMPQASVVERVIAAGPGGENLRRAYQAQNEARMSMLGNISPIDPNGFASARADTGAAIAKFARSADEAARKRTSELYKAVPQDDAAVYLPDLAKVRDQFFGRGAFADRAAADRAVATANQIGTMELPAIKAVTAGRQEQTLAQAVRKAGGISLTENSGFAGELRGLKGDVKRLVFAKTGKSPADMAEAMFEAGYLPNDDPATLIELLRRDATTGPVFSGNADLSRQFAAARDLAAGDAPGAAIIPKKVTLGEFDRLRQDIGAEARTAALAGNDRVSSAMKAMRSAMDDKLNQVIAGDGAADEVLPVDWLDKLKAAQASKRAQAEQFRAGPQAEIFKQTAPGVYAKEGGEVAALFWGNRPGLREDVQSLKKLIGDNPEVMGRFRSMVTTEGAAKAASGDVLGQRFVQWSREMLPGLKEAFSPAQVRMIQRIADDIERASSAAKLGLGVGSNTYQNASNALGLGLLDGRVVDVLANRIPLVGQFTGPALDALRLTAKDAKGRRLAGLLSDAEAAAEALSAIGYRGEPGLGLLSVPLSRAAPSTVADR